MTYELDTHMPEQAGEMSEDQYNAMTPEQQAAYWHQWQQYSAQQYYTAAPDPQQQHYDPAAQYAQDPQYAAQYAQYQVRLLAGPCTSLLL